MARALEAPQQAQIRALLTAGHLFAGMIRDVLARVQGEEPS